ncbi:MAG: hypothetical protein PVG53_08680 [Holophagae bacterium]
MSSTADRPGGQRPARAIVDGIRRHPPVVLDHDELEILLEAADLVRDDDTCLAGRIRILDVDGVSLVQEQTQDGRILVRRLDSEDAARRLVDDRLATYERMWDGCGCKVDYDREP